MFSPAAARREVPLSLATSLSPAVPGLISAWHLERRAAPRRLHPAAFCCYLSHLRHNFFFFFSSSHKKASVPHGEEESLLGCHAGPGDAAGAACRVLPVLISVPQCHTVGMAFCVWDISEPSWQEVTNPCSPPVLNTLPFNLLNCAALQENSFPV